MAADFSHTKLSGQESLSARVIPIDCQRFVAFGMTKIPSTDSERAERLSQRLEEQRKLLEYLPLWLRKKNVSQRTLAEHLAVSEATISKWISGKDTMPVGALRQIAFLLGQHQGDLVRAPGEAGVGERVERTLQLMDKLTPEEWDRVLGVADAIGKAKG